MEIRRPPAELIPFGLRAMKMVALANGEFADAERNLLGSVQGLFGSNVDIDALDPIEPDELAAKLVDPALRRQFLRGMVLLSLIDGEASPAEAAIVERFAKALGVTSPDLQTLRNIADKNLMRARFDIGRRFFGGRKAVEMAKAKGIGWVASTLAAMAGIREDKTIADRYRALADAPEGSLGRAYADFVKKNEFTFPGEKGSPPEAVVFHDLTHVLSGYGTDPAGELQVLAFHAGCRREGDDPFSFLMFGIAEFHLGLSMSPVASASKGQLVDLPAVFRALERGSKCTVDPTTGWDPWPVMNEPLEGLRERYGIAPLE